MTNVDTQKEAYSTVTQVVYETVFEGTEVFREISQKQAEQRRAEEAAREQAAREESAAKKGQDSAPSKVDPSVIIDIQSTAVDTATASQPAAAASAHTVNLIA